MRNDRRRKTCRRIRKKKNRIIFQYKEMADFVQEELKQAFLAGLKAGRQKWHRVDDGDLPEYGVEVLNENGNKVRYEMEGYAGDSGQFPSLSGWIAFSEYEGREDCYNYLAEKLSNDLGIENLKITETMSYGYDGYVFEVKFSFLDEEYKLTIPDVAYIMSDNIENCNEGKMVLFIKTGESFWSEVVRSYDFDDFRKYFSGKVI